MSDLQWTVVKLQQMLAERNTAECDASKRDAEHAACRIANESLVHDLMRVMDERDRLQAEVQRLQGEVRQAQTGHDCALVAAYESGLRAGQEAMRERCAAACDHLRQHVDPQACTCTTSRHHSPYCEGWQDALDHGESAIRALALEVPHD